MHIKVHFCIELLCVPVACTSQFQSSFAFVVSVSYLTIQVHILPAKMFNKEILVVVEVLSHNYSKKLSPVPVWYLSLKIDNSLFLAIDFSLVHLSTLLPMFFLNVILLVHINCLSYMQFQRKKCYNTFEKNIFMTSMSLSFC